MNNFLASIAVFSELCNSDGDLREIIGRFIKSVYSFEQNWSISYAEMTLLLKKHFDFDLPEAVVKTSLNKLKDSGFVNKVNGKYSVNDPKFDIQEFVQKFEAQKKNQSQLENELIKYYESVTNNKCDDNCKNGMLLSLHNYLLDNTISDPQNNHPAIISSFLIEKESDKQFVSNLQQIKEGVVLLTGLKYTSDLNTISEWTDKLIIFLDTEILFNAVGYNGELFKKLFDDFYALVKEVNHITLKKNGNKVIHLKYFGDTRDEVDKFFNVAERIIRREENLTPNNGAMEEICKGFKDTSDVILKKTKFYDELQKKEIYLQEEQDYYSKPEYNIEDESIIKKYTDKINEELIVSILHSFTKVNYFRRGIKSANFESCRYIIMTGKNASLTLSHDFEIRSDSKSFSFATNIFSVTNRLWFKLNKGLAKSNRNLITFDTLAKARIVLASQLSKSVERKYEELKEKLKEREISKDVAHDYYHSLRERAKKPEEINEKNVQESIEFIFSDKFEDFINQQAYLKEKVEEGIKASRELAQWKRSKKNTIKAKYKLRINCMKKCAKILPFILLLIITVIIYYSILSLISTNDTILNLIALGFAIFVEAIGLFKYWKRYLLWINNKLNSYYINLITHLTQIR